MRLIDRRDAPRNPVFNKVLKLNFQQRVYGPYPRNTFETNGFDGYRGLLIGA